MLHVTDEWQDFYDPAMFGMTDRGIYWGAYAMTGLMGFVIPQTSGEEEIAGVALFRAEDYEEDIDYDVPVGIALGKASAARSFQGVGHKSDTWYVYDASPFNGQGVLGGAYYDPVRVRTDGSGQVIDPPLPNPPSYISARPIAGGKARVIIGYSAAGQAVAPTDLAVYGKQVTDPDAPDTTGLWTTPLTDDVTGLQFITCRPEQRRYVFNVAQQTNGQFWIFGAAFRNAGAVYAANTVVSNVIEIVDAGPPPMSTWRPRYE